MANGDSNFPEINDILLPVNAYVANDLKGIWPDDDWLTIGSWDANLWLDDGAPVLTIYPINSYGQTMAYLGIRIQGA